MAKTMRNVVITAIFLIVVAGAACWMVLTGGCTAAFAFLGDSNPFASAQVATANMAIDQLGIKERIDSELRSHAQEIANATGIPVEILNAGIDDLAIKDWKAVEKPSGVTETGKYSIDANGTQVGITTDDDSSVVGVEAYGVEATLGVPESARPYTALIPLGESQDEISAIGNGDYAQVLSLVQQMAAR